MEKSKFDTLINFPGLVPGIQQPIVTGEEDVFWWIKFAVDIHHKLAWNIIQ